MRSPTTRMRRLEKPSTSASSRSLRSASPGSGCTERAMIIESARLKPGAPSGLRLALQDARQNPARGGRQIVEHRVGGEVRRTRCLLLRPVSRAYKDCSGTHGTGQPDVHPGIAHNVGSTRIHTEVAFGALNHACGRLPAAADDRVFI